MTDDCRKIVVIDDDSADVELLRRRLATVPELTFELRHLSDVRTAAKDVVNLAADMVFIDYYLGSCSGLDLVQAVRAADDVLPIIMLTGQGSEEVASNCLRRGADDYVSKAALSADVLRRALQHAQARAVHRRAEAKLRLLQYSIDHASEPVFWVSQEGRLTYVNNALCKALGYDHAELLASRIEDIAPAWTSAAWQELYAQLEQTGSLMQEAQHRRRDGTLFPVEVNLNFVRFQGSRQVCIFARDLSERKRAEEKLRDKEEQLRHKQRLEVIGSLAGGVAHEFNNLLQVIRGYTDCAMEDLPVDGPIYRNLLNVVEAADRAVSITRKLLDFSRRRPAPQGSGDPADDALPKLQRRALDPNQAVSELAALLRPLIGSQIMLNLDLQSQVDPIYADADLFQQILMNLCVNARDAMPEGGELCIKTANVELTVDEPWATAGRYVQIRVSDTGCGMSYEVMERMFDPFFTTKDIGKGTGLGLSMVHGIVQQHGGFLRTQSRVGAGTIFQIYFPVCVLPPQPEASPRMQLVEPSCGCLLTIS